MAAKKIFEDVIRVVEHSKLNYFINKTPFSAIISLKCSLIKRFEDSPEAESERVPKVKDTERDDLKLENGWLKEKLKSAEASLEELKALEIKFNESDIEKKRLESLNHKDKDTVKGLETQISDFRDELLKVKSDRNNISQKLKALEKEIMLIIEERNKTQKETKELKEEMKEKAKAMETRA